MPIQTQRFEPLKARHYTLAETQDEKDAALRRDLIKIRTQQQGQASLQASRQNAASNIQNKNIKANAEAQAVSNEIDQRQVDEANTLNAEQESYDRGQTELSRKESGLARKRQDELDNQRLSISQKNSNNLEYATGRQKEEDARADKFRNEKETFKNQTLAFGAIGMKMSDAISEGKYIGDSAMVDLSGEKDALRLLAPHYAFKNTPAGVISEDGQTLTLMDGDKVIMGSKGKDPVTIKTSHIRQAQQFTEDEFARQLGIGISNGNTADRKEAFSRFKFYQKAEEDANKVLNEMRDSAASPELLTEQAQRVEKLGIKAEEYSALSEGVNRETGEKLNLSAKQFNNNTVIQDKPSLKSVVDEQRNKRKEVGTQYDKQKGLATTQKNKNEPLQGTEDIRAEMIRIIEAKVKVGNTVGHLTNKQLAALLVEAGITSVLGREISQ